MRILGILLLLPLLAGCADTGSNDHADGEEGQAMHDHMAVPRIDAAALLADLDQFATQHPSRAANHADHVASRDWLEAQFQDAGLETYRHKFNDGIDQENVIGIKWGSVRDHWVVVGGHYDVVPQPQCPDPVPCPAGSESQGAYDDGSGTLITVHLAKAFAEVNTTYTIAFVAFDGEERGLQGSGAFAEQVAAGQTPYGNITFHAMLDLDMIGLNCPGVDVPIYFDSNSPELDQEVERLVNGLGYECDIKYQGITAGRSDYAHFFELGVPTGFFISDFEEWQMPGDVPAQGNEAPQLGEYPFWHLADTMDTMELMAGSPEDLQAGFQTAADLASGLLCFMANRPDVVFTVEATE